MVFLNSLSLRIMIFFLLNFNIKTIDKIIFVRLDLIPSDGIMEYIISIDLINIKSFLTC